MVRTVYFPIVGAAQRHREFVAHLAAQRTWLRETKMMWIAGLTAANEARLGGDEFEVCFVALSPRFAEQQNHKPGMLSAQMIKGLCEAVDNSTKLRRSATRLLDAMDQIDRSQLCKRP
jgi:hypothetical protein